MPIYFGVSKAVGSYFRDHHVELDALTGEHIALHLAQEIVENDAHAIVAVIDGKRFESVELTDPPCLWIEDDQHRRAVVKLPTELDAVGRMMAALCQAARQTRNATDLAEITQRLFDADAAQRPSVLGATLRYILTDLGGVSSMAKSRERLIALICGVIFVGAILVIALFIPNPTSFQYTIFRIVLALAAGGFVSMTPGFIEAKVGNAVRAGGALAAFVIVFFFAPAALPVDPPRAEATQPAPAG